MEIILTAVFIACFFSIWVTELTKLDGGLLWWVPKYYPYEEKFLGKVLRCSICLSGWASILVLPIVAYFYGNYILILPSVFLSMAAAKIISK